VGPQRREGTSQIKEEVTEPALRREDAHRIKEAVVVLIGAVLNTLILKKV
jgi:hypothetical protein